MDHRWRLFGLCRKYDPDIFFDPEKEELAASICATCPVKHTCANYALEYNERFGVWGGLTERQRRKATTKRTRVTCPGCGSSDVEKLRTRHESCISCGLSWPI